MQTSAEAKYVRQSPRKVREVIDMIRGKGINEVFGLLPLTSRRASPIVEKVVRSALANAQERARRREGKVDVDRLYVAQAFVNGGPVLKRIREKAMGRAAPYVKRTSHIKVVLRER